jgi:hypothetical protein
MLNTLILGHMINKRIVYVTFVFDALEILTTCVAAQLCHHQDWPFVHRNQPSEADRGQECQNVNGRIRYNIY